VKHHAAGPWLCGCHPIAKCRGQPLERSWSCIGKIDVRANT
jgi:hypothetical protein